MSYLRLILVTVLFAADFSVVRAESGHNAVFETLNWNELRPSAIQSESLLEDEPGGRPVIDQTTDDLWMVGNHFVWKWNLRDGSLSRLATPVGVRRPFKLVHVSTKGLIALDGLSAWVLDLSKKTWRKLDGRMEAGCVPARVIPLRSSSTVQVQRVYIATDCGVYLVLADSGQLIRVTDGSTSGDFKEVTDAVAFGQEGSILAVSDRELILFRGQGSKARREVVYTAKSRLLGVTTAGEHILAWTSHALLVFDRRLKRQQVAPVLGTRKIQSFAAGKDHHVIGFSDGTIEMIDLDRQRKWATGGGEYSAQSIDFIADDGLVVLSTVNALPRVFSVTNLR